MKRPNADGALGAIKQPALIKLSLGVLLNRGVSGSHIR